MPTINNAAGAGAGAGASGTSAENRDKIPEIPKVLIYLLMLIDGTVGGDDDRTNGDDRRSRQHGGCTIRWRFKVGSPGASGIFSLPSLSALKGHVWEDGSGLLKVDGYSRIMFLSDEYSDHGVGLGWPLHATDVSECHYLDFSGGDVASCVIATSTAAFVDRACIAKFTGGWFRGHAGRRQSFPEAHTLHRLLSTPPQRSHDRSHDNMNDINAAFGHHAPPVGTRVRVHGEWSGGSARGHITGHHKKRKDRVRVRFDWGGQHWISTNGVYQVGPHIDAYERFHNDPKGTWQQWLEMPADHLAQTLAYIAPTEGSVRGYAGTCPVPIRLSTWRWSVLLLQVAPNDSVEQAKLGLDLVDALKSSLNQPKPDTEAKTSTQAESGVADGESEIRVAKRMVTLTLADMADLEDDLCTSDPNQVFKTNGNATTFQLEIDVETMACCLMEAIALVVANASWVNRVRLLYRVPARVAASTGAPDWRRLVPQSLGGRRGKPRTHWLASSAPAMFLTNACWPVVTWQWLTSSFFSDITVLVPYSAMFG